MAEVKGPDDASHPHCPTHDDDDDGDDDDVDDDDDDDDDDLCACRNPSPKWWLVFLMILIHVL